ncbi:22538_t:CDS:2 [Rhizophagus irregularis]|nr:22538_t:CDS:2 [Rhizophagus irregularis]
MPVKPTNWNLNNKVLPDETDSSYKIESCEYMSEGDADNESNQVVTLGKKNLDVSASLFIGNLDSGIGEKMLYDTFSTFDPDTGNSKGYGFISYDNFDSSDAAIDAMMNGQYLMNIPITVSYAFKKDGKGERHRSAAGSYFLPNRPSEEKSKSADPFVCGCTVSSPMIGFHAQTQQINTGMSCPGIPPLIVSLTNIYGGYHAPGTNTQTITTTLSRMMGSISRTWTLFFSLGIVKRFLTFVLFMMRIICSTFGVNVPFVGKSGKPHTTSQKNPLKTINV